MATEEAFQDLFITTGYSTAFGAVFGAALGTTAFGLEGENRPSRMNFFVYGASLGFLFGSVLGAHIIITTHLGGYPEFGVSTRYSDRLSLVPTVSEDGRVGAAATFTTFFWN
jgi:hypothetical protein